MITEITPIMPMAGPSSENDLLHHTDEALDSLSFTHGYVHGHVHRHNDYMHIHGHIHNHDHTPAEAPVADTAALKQALEPTVSCHEFDEMCRGIFCDELDDCYFEECSMGYGAPDDACGGHCEDLSDGECCHSPECSEETETALCTDPECTSCDHHANSLCESQRSKLGMFENLLQNVQKNVEEVLQPVSEETESAPSKRRKTENPHKLQIHFPHPCHSGPATQLQEEPEPLQTRKTDPSVWLVLPEAKQHHTHQTCFHAKVPSSSIDQTTKELHPDASKHLASNFDFVIQFDNFNQMMNLSNDEFANQPLFNDPGFSYPRIEPTAVPCQWENCQKKVENTNLVDHLVKDHIKDEHSLHQNHVGATGSFECEWNNCDFMDHDYTVFLSHLTEHKMGSIGSNINDAIIPKSNDEIAALLTPDSISENQYSSPSDMKKEPQNMLNITSIKISPKSQDVSASADTSFTCKWQIGTDADGKPIVCGLAHSCEGELQHHLQDDHIGQGKSVYHCCWIGCDRHGGKSFIQRQKLYRHIHIHTQYKPCKCSVCGASFAVPAILKQHMRIHSGEKPFTCNVCGKTFATSSSLSIHNRVHSGERPLQCTWPGCEKRFSESSNLAKHLRLHTKTFTCETCGEVFDKKTEYTRHKKNH